MRKHIICLFLLICCAWGAQAQTSDARTGRVEVNGVVLDENNEPLIGVNVTVKDMPGLGVITDIDGKFRMKMEPYHWLVFSYVGFDKQEVLVKEAATLHVVLKESSGTMLDEVVITGTGAQKKVTMTGAVTNVEVDELKTSTSSITNALAGNVVGVMARQTSGRPGQNE